MNAKGLEINKALVVGLGYRSGLAACNFLAAGGVSVTASDIKAERDLADVLSRMDRRVKTVLGIQDPGLIDGGFDALILSPGVPRTIPLVARAYEKSVPVISEIELAYRFMKGRIIGITGTDGKSTTTALTGHVLRELGIKTVVGGNIGIPLVSLVGETSDDSVSVVELSSYQLETITDFRPEAACLLNVTPDHLDRYDGMESYLDAKLRIAMNQTWSDVFVYNLDDPLAVSGAARVRSTRLSFSLADGDADIFLRGGRAVLKKAGVEVLDRSGMRIPGLHNMQNAMASVLMVSSLMERMGMSPDYNSISRAVYSFTGLPHRMERIGEYEGRVFINDSKATTVGAVEMAVRSLDSDGVLILGGRTKGDDYSRLARSLGGRIKALVLIGESKESFSGIFAGFRHVTAEGMDDALAKAMGLSGRGDTIILSPACASFDMFRNFEERGDAFRASFEKLKKGVISWT